MAIDWGNVDESDCVLRFVAGPHLYGIDDPLPAIRDEVAVVIESPGDVIVAGELRPVTYESDELRLTQLSLREFVRRALGGNLTTILPLLAPSAIVYRSEVGEYLTSDPTDFLGAGLRRSVPAYLGRNGHLLMGSGGGRGGYDHELACRLIRIGHQALEALYDQRVTLPVPEPLRSHLRAVRSGECRPGDVVGEIDSLIGQLELAPVRMREPPVEVEYEQWLIRVYREHWDRTWRPIMLE